ncbi:GNAT family N-acetyltransferase [Candidatus Bathyarchaeota archaeon]|nr:GNAT family N-acetyltransferase [Candidatus Bathyarchaeota archaeon]
MIEANFGRSLSSLKPSEGILYILKVDGVTAGMGALRRLDDSVGEIKRMYVRPSYRGKGYGKKCLKNF